MRILSRKKGKQTYESMLAVA